MPGTPEHREGAPVLEQGRRVWRTYREIALDADPFPDIGAAFEGSGAVRQGRVGIGEARLFRQRAAVDFAAEWLRGPGERRSRPP